MNLLTPRIPQRTFIFWGKGVHLQAEAELAGSSCLCNVMGSLNQPWTDSAVSKNCLNYQQTLNSLYFIFSVSLSLSVLHSSLSQFLLTANGNKVIFFHDFNSEIIATSTKACFCQEKHFLTLRKKRKEKPFSFAKQRKKLHIYLNVPGLNLDFLCILIFINQVTCLFNQSKSFWNLEF